MIKIEKDKYGPDVRYDNNPNKGLLTWKVAESKVLKAIKQDPKSFSDGTYKFPQLHKSEEYRTELIRCQGHKCCFCERALDGGQIEHFRPKKAWQQKKGDTLTKPGYYWLAYRWNNFLISCPECNQSGRKGNLFPIQGVRATDQNSNLIREQHDLINPSEEDPSQFISFNKEIPIGIDADGRGDINIRIFDLKDRADLKSGRLDRFQLYEAQKMISEMKPSGTVNAEKIKEAKSILAKARKSKQPFAGMIRENIKKGFL